MNRLHRPTARYADRARICVIRFLPLAALLIAALAGCAPKAGPGVVEPGQAQALWAGFVSESAEPVKSFSMSASLNLQSPQKSARLLLKFWGNLDRPLRLDLSSGMGQTYSLWREDTLGWLAVYPMSNQVFTHANTKAALAKLGMPFPFSLKDLAAICSEHYGLILPARYKKATTTARGFEYSLAAPSPVASVTLDFEGNPIHLTGRGVEPWTVDMGDFTPAEPGRKPEAQRITLVTPGGVKAILRIKKLELSPEPMAEQALDLPVPPQARHIPLDRAGDVQTPELP